MHVLIINPIVYTAETRNIPRVKSIQDTMIYDLCLAFHQQGHRVTLFAAAPYRPESEETYPFEVIWAPCVFEKLFAAHRFPVLAGLKQYLKQHGDSIDRIITGEVFSLNSLRAYRALPKKTIVWHELAVHNRLGKTIPSKLWYNLVARFLMRNATVVPRSPEAGRFIRQYCKRVSEQVIDHGVNLQKFDFCSEKKNYFMVCSQLIERKRIDGILEKFSRYLQKKDPSAMLYIAGDGEQRAFLEEKARQLGCGDRVVFKGKMSHEDMMPLLAQASALLINTVKDNSMISIVEAIAAGTPVVTTDVPLNSSYIIQNRLGIAKPVWDEEDLGEIVQNNAFYVSQCEQYREKLSTEYRVGQFLGIELLAK